MTVQEKVEEHKKELEENIEDMLPKETEEENKEDKKDTLGKVVDVGGEIIHFVKNPIGSIVKGLFVK